MTRTWSALYGSMLAKAKYRRLSPLGRGALLHTWILAGFQSPEAAWEDPDQLREALILDGFPAAVFDELLGLGWLEREGEAVVVHDWDDHQLAATKEAQREWEAARKREWRRKKVSPTPLSKKQDNTTQHNSPAMSGTGTGHVRDREELGMRYPTPNVSTWKPSASDLEEIEKAHAAGNRVTNP